MEFVGTCSKQWASFDCKCKSCRVKIVQKLSKRSPLKYKLTQAASYLDHSSILAATYSLSAQWHLRPLAYCFISTAAVLLLTSSPIQLGSSHFLKFVSMLAWSSSLPSGAFFNATNAGILAEGILCIWPIHFPFLFMLFVSCSCLV
ncbi:hypothetical protein CDAR_178351 [Caerostris darwini]|uniref:Uncharacterized protein n=1 Tax=Caerostris darwini TaxID=1538125 RepID=A0AAV4PCE5_9ARAC|nr:hypothetical protein CDAR_178351 [Caerostris darwini]